MIGRLLLVRVGSTPALPSDPIGAGLVPALFTLRLTFGHFYRILFWQMEGSAQVEDPLADTPWYHRWFGTDYLKLYQHRSAQEAVQTVNWLVRELEIKPPCRVLDLACGSGRHSVQLAQRGFTTYSLDLSWPLLQATAISDHRLTPRRVRGDMRRLPFGSAIFGLVLSLFTSFGYFDSEEEDLRVLQEVARVLQPEAFFVLDFLNAMRVKWELIPREVANFDGSQATIERWVEESGNRVEKRITVKGPDGDESQYHESVSLYGESDLRRMLKLVGISAQRAYGSYDGAKYTEGSPRLIIIGVKRA